MKSREDKQFFERKKQNRFLDSLTVGGLVFGRGNAKVCTGDKLSNSRKTFREQAPRMTPNRLLAASVFISAFLLFIFKVK